MRNVKGILFADYVRMIRSHKGTDWSLFLHPEDLAYLTQRVDPAGWYPMTTFERMGNAILKVIAHDDLNAVRMWGQFSVDQLRFVHPQLLAPDDPVESLTRFRVLRSTFFDFEALSVPMLHDDEAQVIIHYHMGMPAEEAASLQTMGFFERLLTLAGAKTVDARFRLRSWAGDGKTLMELRWSMT